MRRRTFSGFEKFLLALAAMTGAAATLVGIVVGDHLATHLGVAMLGTTIGIVIFGKPHGTI